MNNIIANVKKKLHSGESKLTPRREQVLKVLIENRGKHLSAEDVYNLVKESVLDLGLATVYRTLELFQEFGVVNCMDFGDGRKRYEIDDPFGECHQHHHLICMACGEILEVEEDLLEELEKKILTKYQFKVTNHELKVFGYCRNCTENK